MDRESKRMTKHSKRKWCTRHLAVLIPLVMMLSLFLPAPVQAEGGIAISGNFYRQNFRLFPGESLTSPDIYVQVFNNSDIDMQVSISNQAPPGVEIILSPIDFTLPPGGQQKVAFAIEVSPEAIPGEYEVGITADSHPEAEEEGFRLAGAAQQEANLTILGEAGSVSIVTLTHEGEPFTGIIRIFEQTESDSNLCGYSNTGISDMRLAPGDYKVECYLENTLVAEDSFTLAADEEKSLTLTSRTAFIVGFSTVPNYYTESKELAFANMEYTIKNIYQHLEDIEVILKANLDGTVIDELSIFSLSTLNTGNTAASYNNYVPPEGWESGNYGFTIELHVQGELYNQSREVLLSTDIVLPNQEPGSLNWYAIIVILMGTIMVAAAVFPAIVVHRRRRGRAGQLPK